MINRLKAALIALPASLMSLPTLAQAVVVPSSDWHSGWGWGHMIFGSVMMTLLWGGFVVAVVFAARGRDSGSSLDAIPVLSANKALNILRERFVSGEINKVEFDELKRRLAN